ncbi:hypothetical protein FVEG_16655 [Fusarium verticillioides 7600]|uniref:Uncharacterized protein n=1 Tax=Gibberella moniliformis (strain M3125 / FGSC 7600) TaxID=334819 RepID=W7MS58_GIBM7|nr:hypothetical protein FVEG_16655 [Fusarium verticillioides 7600]EWG50579.1 hypothetical protein FVEG_16655 [Fusarium verticillioides 7600]
MAFLTPGAAQMIGHVLFIVRKRGSESMRLSEAARMAGISKSLIISIDLPLFIPYPDSTAMASYVTSISNMSIFNNMDDAQGFLSVHVIEDKLIHLGQSWKPLTTTNRHKWAQAYRTNLPALTLEGASSLLVLWHLQQVIPPTWPATPFIAEDSITTGDSRKAMFSLVVADETMIFLEDRVARTFCALLLSLRKKIAPSLSLSAVTRMAGVDKSLVMSIDMPLCIPNPDSTAMASYISSIADIGFFAK